MYIYIYIYIYVTNFAPKSYHRLYIKFNIARYHFAANLS